MRTTRSWKLLAASLALGLMAGCTLYIGGDDDHPGDDIPWDPVDAGTPPFPDAAWQFPDGAATDADPPAPDAAWEPPYEDDAGFVPDAGFFPDSGAGGCT
jgi:hypothetical protein